MKRNSFDYQFILVLRARDGRSLGAFPTLHKRAAAIRTAQSALQLRGEAAYVEMHPYVPDFKLGQSTGVVELVHRPEPEKEEG